MNKTLLPYNIQFFAEGEPQAGGTDPTTQQAPPASSQTSQGVDYTKIQQMLDGTLKAKEDVALKAYFKQQGLSQDEAEQAISTFKQQKAANQPDVSALQTELAQAQAATQKAILANAATMMALGMGLDSKSIHYLLRMVDLSQTVDKDGKINEESMKNVLGKVLEDVPALKPQPAQATGFIQVGASGAGQQPQNTDDALKKAFGL